MLKFRSKIATPKEEIDITKRYMTIDHFPAENLHIRHGLIYGIVGKNYRCWSLDGKFHAKGFHKLDLIPYFRIGGAEVDAAAWQAKFDQAWVEINALHDYNNRGYISAADDAINAALTIIEKLGGMDPQKRGKK